MKYPDLEINTGEYKSILVIGNSEAAQCLYERLLEQVEPNQKVIISRSPVDDHFDLVIDVDRQDRLSLDHYDYSLYYQVSHDYCMGFTPARKLLHETDWQAQRDLERLVLAWHDDGRINLPIATLNLFRLREAMRSETDTEPHDVI